MLFSLLLLLVMVPIGAKHTCVHTEFSQNATKHYLHDLTPHRLLADAEIGRYFTSHHRIRMFADYTQVCMSNAT